MVRRNDQSHSPLEPQGECDLSEMTPFNPWCNTHNRPWRVCVVEQRRPQGGEDEASRYKDAHHMIEDMYEDQRRAARGGYDMSDLVERLNKAGIPLQHEAATEITRLRKVVDALTVKLNKVLNEQYIAEQLLKERIDNCEHVMSRLSARVQQLRQAREP